MFDPTPTSLLPADSVLSISVPIVKHTEDLSGFRG
jgi:hypothetical protein